MAEKMKPQTIDQANDALKIDVVGCARCGEIHDQLGFRRLKRSVAIPVSIPGAQIEATHWAPCPTTEEPILLALCQG